MPCSLLKSSCPCGSGNAYAECCQPYHLGKAPENALALMKSRYSAYTHSIPEYIIYTTHPANPSFMKDTIAWTNQIMKFCKNTTFERLEILDFKDGAVNAFVIFKAHLKQKNQDATFTEKSRFEKVADRWLYLDGQIIRPVA
jgi:SEC-C motif-containing protein